VTRALKEWVKSKKNDLWGSILDNKLDNVRLEFNGLEPIGIICN
jgi:hypothetical protein